MLVSDAHGDDAAFVHEATHPTDFPMSKRLLRMFAALAWTGAVCIVAALVAPFWTHGPMQAVIMSTLLSGGLFLCIVGFALHIRGSRTLARLRGSKAMPPSD